MKGTAKELRTLSHDTYKTAMPLPARRAARKSGNKWTAAREKKEPALTIHTEIFQFAGRSLSTGARRINAHYRYLAKRFKRWGRRTLYRKALAAYKAAGPETAAARKHGKPSDDASNHKNFIPHTLSVKHNVTCNRDGLLSLYHDHAENDGQAQEAVCRIADTWRLSDGLPVTLKDLCPKRTKTAPLRLAVIEAGRRREAGQAAYVDRYARAMRRHFNKSRFYLTDRGVALFWQAGDIAPASKGVQEVVVPYETWSAHSIFHSIDSERNNFPLPGQTIKKQTGEAALSGRRKR